MQPTFSGPQIRGPRPSAQPNGPRLDRYGSKYRLPTLLGLTVLGSAGCDDPGFAVFISVMILFAVVGWITSIVARMKGRSTLGEAFASQPGFKGTRTAIGVDGAAGVAIDEHSRKVCLSVSGPPPIARVVDYGAILEAEVLEDGETVTKTSRTSQAGRAVLGGLLLGPVGALAGALTATTRSKDKVHRVDLKIVVNDTSKPIHVVNFLSGEWERGSAAYQAGMSAAREWHALFLAVIEQADRESKAASPSVADELTKLADLRDRGILTPDEFDKQKAQVLAKQSS